MRRQRRSFLRWLSLILILGAVVLSVVELVGYSRTRATFPRGLKIAGVPVGGLDRQEAAERLLEVYSTPVVFHYSDAVFQLNPSVVGFELNLETMLAAADLERTEKPFWIGFWDYLWEREEETGEVPLTANYSEDRLRAFLNSEIAPRYDKPASPPSPAVGTVNFAPGSSGTSLNIDQAILPIENALWSISDREVKLPLERTNPPRLPFDNLEVLFKQTVDISDFDGLVGMYLLDLQTAQEIHFLYQSGQELSSQPDVAFTAASIIKIPIMVSVYKRVSENPDDETIKLLEEMIELSGNDPADWVMERVIEPNLGPLSVTEDMRTLGLVSTFIAGHFYLGAPLLVRYETPGNQRSDIDTDPDPYNQTTVSEIGTLLADIYQCAQSRGGALLAVFPGEITQSECRAMVTFLTRNRIGVLLEAGTPEGTQLAHKHGWVTDGSGIINTIGDAGIVYTPGGNYVMVVFLYHPVQLVWDPASTLIAQLSRAAYNYYNQQE